MHTNTPMNAKPSLCKSSRVLAGSIAALLAVQAAQGAAITWDTLAGDGGGVITDGSGTWTDGLGNWNDGVGDVNWSNANPDSATFGGGSSGAAGTVTLGSGITAGSITFATPFGGGAYTIDTSTFALTLNTGITANESGTIQSGVGGGISLGANNSWSLGATKTLTVTSNISGTGFSLAKSGAGTLLLSGTNTYDGGTALNGGVIALGSAGALGTVGTISFGGGTLQFSAANTTDYSARFSTAPSQAYNLDTNGQNVTLGTTLTSVGGTLSKAGAGTLTLTGGNNLNSATISGGTIAGGTVTLSGGATALTSSATSAVNSNVTITTAAGTITSSAGTLTLGGTLNAGSFALNFAGAGSTTVTNTITNGTSVTMNGGGTLTLSSANTYTGGTVVNTGVLSTSNAGAFGSGSITLANGAIFRATGGGTPNFANNFSLPSGSAVIDVPFGGGADVTISGTISGAGGLTVTSDVSGRRLLLSSANTFLGNVVLSGGAVNTRLAIGNAAALGTGTLVASNTGANGGLENTADLSAGAGVANNIQITTGAILNVGGSSTLAMRLSGVISDAGSLVKLGSGTVILSGANTYTGTTTVSAGTLSLGSAQGGSSGPLGNPTVPAGSIIFAGGTLQYSALNNTDYSSRMTATSNSGYLIDTSLVNVTLGTALPVVGTNALTKSGIGTLLLPVAQSYTGLTTVSAGTLAYGVNDAILTGGITVNGTGAVLSLGSFSDTVGTVTLTAGDITGTGTLTGTGTFTMNNAAAATVSPILAGAVGLTKTGAGVLTLFGANTYTGTTAINGGTVNVGAVETAGTSGPLGNPTVPAGSISFGGGTLQYSGVNNFDYSSRMTATSNSSYLIDTNNVNVTFASALPAVGTNVLTKSGVGTLTLSAANNYTGLTTVSAGTLAYGVSNAILTGGITVNGTGAQLSLGSFSDSVGTVTLTVGDITGSGTLTGTGTFTMNNTATATASPVLAGAVGLTKSGASVLALYGANTYTGTTAINAGTVRVSAVETPGTSGPLGNPTVPAGSISFGGGTLQYSVVNNFDYSSRITATSGSSYLIDTYGRDVTFANALPAVGTNVLTKSGAGTLTLSVANTYTGATNVNGGVLAINGVNTGAGAVTVNKFGGLSALGGTGTVPGAVTLALGDTSNFSGAIKLTDGAVGTLTLGAGLTFNGSAAIANYVHFDLGAAGAGTDKISVTGNTAVTTTGGAVIRLNQLGGAATRVDAGTYDLIATTGTMAALGQFVLPTTRAFGQTFALQLDGTTKKLQVVTTQLAAATPAAFWAGGANNWSTAANWKTDATANTAAGAAPDYQTNVSFYTTTPVAANLTTNVLDTDFDINSLNFTAAATSAVTIGGTKMLTIEATNANGNTAGNGITVNTPTSGTVTHTISANVGLAGSQTWTVNSNATLTVTGTVSDFGGGYSLTKAGAGTLYLLPGGNAFGANPNYFTGGATLAGGTLQFAGFGTNALGTGPLTITTGTLSVAGNNIQTLNNSQYNLNGNFNVATVGGNTLNFSTGNVTLGASIAATVASGVTFNISGTIDDGGNVYSLTKDGAGTMNLSGSLNTYSGKTVVTNGTLQFWDIKYLGIPSSLGAPTTVANGTIDLGNGTTLLKSNASQTNNVTDRVINLAGTGPGTVTVSVNNNDTNLTLNSAFTATGTGAKTLAFTVNGDRPGITLNGAIPNVSDASALTLQVTITGNDQSAGTGRGINLNGVNTFTGPISLTAAAGRLTIGMAGQLGSGSYANTITLNGGNFVYNSQAVQTLSGVISGTGALTMSGAGALTLSNANTYTGLTTLSFGTLTLGNNLTLQNSALSIGTSGSVILGGGVTTPTFGGLAGSRSLASVVTSGYTGVTALTLKPLIGVSNTYSGVIADGAVGMTLTKTGLGTQILSAANSYTGATTISAGTLQLGTGTTGQNGSVASASIVDNAFLVFNNADVQTYAGAISGSGFLTKNGAGNLTLSGTNTYTGTTAVAAGILQYNAVGAIAGSGRNIAVYPGATVALGYVPAGSIQTDLLSRVVTTSVGALGLTAAASPVSEALDFSSGGNNFTALSLGAVGSATFTGTLTPNANTYRLGGGGGALVFNPGGGTFDATQSLVLFGSTPLTGTTFVTPTGTVDFGGASRTFGAVSIQGGTTQNGTITGSSFSADLSAASATVSAVLAGGGGLTLPVPAFTNANTLTLSGANLYSGTTSISSSTLRVTGSLNGTTGTALAFDRSGTFNVNEAPSSAQHMTSLTLNKGDASVQSTFNATSANLTFDAAPTRSAGATAMFVLSGGTVGTAATNANGTLGTNNIILSGQAAQSPMGVAYFAGQNTAATDNYAFYDGAGFVRPIDYVKDAIPAGATTASGAQTSLASTAYAQLQSGGSVSAQANGTAFTGLNIVNTNNSAQAFTLAGGATVSINGILRTGNGGGSSTTTISGGTGIKTTTSGGEMVIRTDLSSDLLTISANILDNATSSLTKSGAGTLTLSGANTYAGGTTINSGTLTIGSNSGIGTGTLTVNGGTVNLLANVSLATTNNPIVVNNNFILSSPNAVSTNIGSGLITLNNSAVVTLTLGQSPNLVNTWTSSNNSSLTLINTQDGGTIISGPINIGSGGLFLRNDLTGNSKTLTVNNTTSTFTGPTTLLSSTSSNLAIVTPNLTNAGVAGPLGMPTGANAVIQAYNGVLWQPSGTTDRGLNLAGNGSGTVSITLNAASATLNGPITATGFGLKTLFLNLPFNNPGTLTINGAISDATDGSPLTLQVQPGYTNGGNFMTINLGGVNTFTGPINYQLPTSTPGSTNSAVNITGAGQLGAGNYAGAISLNTSSRAVFNYASSAAQTLSGEISGAGNLTKSGVSTLTLSGANSYTGVTTITAGILSVGTIGNGGVAGNLGAATNAAANLVFNGGTLQYTGATASTDRNFTINASTTATIEITNGANSLTISGASTATSGALTKTGAGTLVLSGTNLYTGVTRINDGVLSVGTIGNGGVGGNMGAAAVAAGNLVFNGGTLQYTGATASTNRGFTIGGAATAIIDITNGASALTISGASATTSGALTKTGAGTLTLSGANTYSGTTTVSAGTLKSGINSAIKLGNAVTVSATAAGTATLDLAGFNQTLGGVSGAGLILGGGTATSAAVVTNSTGSSTLTLGGGITALTYLETNDPLGATISVTTVVLDSAPQTFTVGPSASATDELTISSAITQASSLSELVKEGAGVLKLDGAQTYDLLTANGGTTNVNGVLGTGSGTAAVAVNNSGTTLRFGSVSQTLSSLTIGAGSTVVFTSGPASGALTGGGTGKAPGFSGTTASTSSFGGGSAVVPEPGTMGLLLVGALGLLNRRRRQA
ncbi:MAG: autotransporter-associated beta strand repeat-containing protein [Chthoniobacter sp.]|nr:autotransporter-associated beta strand repeat-containing protein [Chthoniobacter sp.]